MSEEKTGFVPTSDALITSQGDGEIVEKAGSVPTDGKSFELRFSPQQVAVALAEYITNHSLTPNRVYHSQWDFFSDGSWAVTLSAKEKSL